MSTTGSGRSQQQTLDGQIEPFLQQLRDAGYAERTLCKKRAVARELLPDARNGKELTPVTSTAAT